MTHASCNVHLSKLYIIPPVEYDSSMKVKTSLTLSEDLIDQLDRLSGPGASRSAFIERILRDFIQNKQRAEREAREIAKINRSASRLNAEMEDVLSFQAGAEE
jgi:metal-responsive CopG/Arc/MetJ family transcriptional regulator